MERIPTTLCGWADTPAENLEMCCLPYVPLPVDGRIQQQAPLAPFRDNRICDHENCQGRDQDLSQPLIKATCAQRFGDNNPPAYFHAYCLMMDSSMARDIFQCPDAFCDSGNDNQ